ncbi:hypothetical protein DNTS_014547 [Danionella cerebrum]|uniref:Lipocalin/cytosolic fatty-acid binding domain-containing protein n=1 Tax=Danionella cerebrum TaxID=2873325 RepID=A0A553RLW2_9TELE|nr:hypothetical protein DNTS_014547 [Danionella translucida]
MINLQVCPEEIQNILQRLSSRLHSTSQSGASSLGNKCCVGRKSSSTNIMEFNGQYRLERYEGIEEFMSAIGRPGLAKRMHTDEIYYEFEVNGNDFKITTRKGSNVSMNSFTIGEEAEMDMPSGEIIKTVVKREGNTLKYSLENICCSWELLDSNTLISSLALGDVTYKRFFKRLQ